MEAAMDEWNHGKAYEDFNRGLEIHDPDTG